MTTRNHTNTGLSKWEKITMWSIAAFFIGFIGMIAIDLTGITGTWADVIGIPLGLAELIGLIMAFVSAPKVFGGLKTGITALIIGAALFIIGTALRNSADPSYIMGVEFAPLSDPLYIIGSPMHFRGILFMIVGGIMAIVTYLRRVLQAVESRDQLERRVESYMEDK